MQDGSDGSSPSGVKRATDADRLVGIRITALRKARGLSQTALGEALGVTFQQVQKYEKGANRLSVGRLQKVAELLEVPIQELIVDAAEADTVPNLGALAFLRTPGAIDLLRSYAAIKHADTRRGLVTLAKAIADQDREGNASLEP